MAQPNYLTHWSHSPPVNRKAPRTPRQRRRPSPRTSPRPAPSHASRQSGRLRQVHHVEQEQLLAHAAIGGQREDPYPHPEPVEPVERNLIGRPDSRTADGRIISIRYCAATSIMAATLRSRPDLRQSSAQLIGREFGRALGGGRWVGGVGSRYPRWRTIPPPKVALYRGLPATVVNFVSFAVTIGPLPGGER